MKNIYFIEAKSPSRHIFSFVKLPRLGIIIMATILKMFGYNTKVFAEDISGPIEKLPRKEWRELIAADLICITSLTSTIKRAYQIGDMFRKMRIPVAIGGPHSTFMAEESLEHADFVVRGEGEETIVELVRALTFGKNHPGLQNFLTKIKGLSYKDKECGCVYHTPNRDLIKNLDDAPIPDFNLVYKWMEKARVVPIATSRGCPFACKFCSVIPMFGRQYRFKSVERVIDEIKEAGKYGKRHIFFIDDNFAANKKRLKTLLWAILNEGIKIRWSAQVRVDIAKDHVLLYLMKKTGCLTVFIGFESINPPTLSLYNKGQSIEDIENSIAAVKKYNIKIHGMFVLGADTDTVEIIKNTADFAIKNEVESIQFMMLTPLPGTPVLEELKAAGRLIHTEWQYYDAHHAVFEPKLMTALELHTETIKAMGKFYSPSAFFRSLRKQNYYYAGVHLYGIRSVLTIKIKSINYKRKFLKK